MSYSRVIISTWEGGNCDRKGHYQNERKGAEAIKDNPGGDRRTNHTKDSRLDNRCNRTSNKENDKGST